MGGPMNIGEYEFIPKVLLADDEPLQREMFSNLLREEGYEVITASGGEEALKLLEDTVPDLILLDIMMPRMGGIETCKLIKASSPALKSVPIVMVSVVNMEEYIVEALDAGADDYIIKTENTKVICARVRAHLRSKALYDQIDRLRKDQAIITDIVLQFNANSEMEEIFNRVVAKISRQIGGRISIVKVKDQSDKANVLACSDPSYFQDMEIDLNKYPEIKYSQSSRRPVILKDMSSEIIVEDVAETLKNMGVYSLIIIPLVFDEESDHSIFLRARGDKTVYNNEDIRLCRTIAQAVGNAINYKSSLSK